MDSNLKVGSNNAGLFIGNTEILGGGVTVNYEDGFFNDPGSATAKANDVLFNFTGYGSYLVLVIKE